MAVFGGRASPGQRHQQVAVTELRSHAGTAAVPSPAVQAAARRRAHWQGVRRWTAVSLLVWLLGSFGVPFFARQLDFSFGGGPFSFWWGAQGAMLIDLALVVLYAGATHRMDLAHDLDDED